MKKQWILSLAAVLAFAGMATAQEASAVAEQKATIAKQVQQLDDEQLAKFLGQQTGDKWSQIMNAIFPGAANDLKNKVIAAGEKALNSLGENAQAIADNVNANVAAVTVAKEENLWKITVKEGTGTVAGKEKEGAQTKEETAGAGEEDTTIREIIADLIYFANDIERNTQTERTASGPATKK